MLLSWKELAVAHERANGLEAQKGSDGRYDQRSTEAPGQLRNPRDGASGRQQPKAQLLVALEAILTKGRNADGADVALICVSTSRQIAIFLTSTLARSSDHGGLNFFIHSRKQGCLECFGLVAWSRSGMGQPFEQAARPEFSVLDQELTETIRALGLEGKSAAQVDAIMRASCYRSRL